jgi:hypothetical protein
MTGWKVWFYVVLVWAVIYFVGVLVDHSWISPLILLSVIAIANLVWVRIRPGPGEPDRARITEWLRARRRG